MLVDMIQVMMNLHIYAEDLRKRNIFLFVFIDVKGEIKEDTVFIMKAKPRFQNAHLKRSFSKNHVKLITIRNSVDSEI